METSTNPVRNQGDIEMGTMLRGQVEFSKSQFDELQSEEWKSQHDEVMATYSIADRLGEIAALTIFTFQRIKSSLSSCNESFDRVINTHETLELWNELATAIVDLGDSLAKNEFRVENLEEVRGTMQEASSLLLDVQEAKFAIDCIKADKAITVEQFLDEL